MEENNNEYNGYYRKNKKNVPGTLLKLFSFFIIISLLIFIITNITTVKQRDGKKGLFNRVSVFFQSIFGNLDKNLEIENNTIINTSDNNSVIKNDGKIADQYVQTKKIRDIKVPVKGRHYYNALDENAQIIYTKLKSESGYFLEGFHDFDFGYAFSDFLKNGGEESLKSSFQYAVNSLLFDYPEIFFVDVEKLSLAITTTSFSKTNKVYSVKITNTDGLPYYSKAFKNKNQVEQAKTELETIKNQMVNLLQGKSDYEKIRYVHDYLVDNVEYDSTYNSDNIYNAYGCLYSKKAVCEGYTKAFKYLLDNLGIESIIVAGKSKQLNQNIQRHAWNMVKTSGKWYGVDVTWDDPIIRGGGRATDDIRYKYFMKNKAAFNKTHIADGNIVSDAKVTYPALEERDYGY